MTPTAVSTGGSSLSKQPANHLHVHLQNHLNVHMDPSLQRNPSFPSGYRPNCQHHPAESRGRTTPTTASLSMSQFHSQKRADSHFVPMNYNRKSFKENSSRDDGSQCKSCKSCKRPLDTDAEAAAAPNNNEHISSNFSANKVSSVNCDKKDKSDISWSTKQKRASLNTGLSLGRVSGMRMGGSVISQNIPSLTQGYNRRLEIIVEPNESRDDTASIKTVSETSEQFSDCDFQLEVR